MIKSVERKSEKVEKIVRNQYEFLIIFKYAHMLAAHALGIGSCWIHRAKQMYTSEEGQKLLKEWGVTENYIGVGHCILGYPEGEHPKAKPRKEGYIIRAKA
ncbi:hypothetical protein FACS18947_5340 [Bacteroidia bacterium]|nr:hypothetical protein FACS18947_5340 [Bacteroidia bacterium]